MAEYIEREDAIDAVLDVYYNTPDIDLSGERLEAAILKVQPTYIAPSGRLRGVTYEDGKVTDVHVMDTDDVVKVFAPVRHGRWIEYMKVIIPEPYNKWEQAWKCSECGFDDGFIADRFCPNCGAKMNKE